MQGMNYNQTNGIPQGSVLMNFIAESGLKTQKIKINQTS
jgi:hypothetical protein